MTADEARAVDAIFETGRVPTRLDGLRGALLMDSALLGYALERLPRGATLLYHPDRASWVYTSTPPAASSRTPVHHTTSIDRPLIERRSQKEFVTMATENENEIRLARTELDRAQGLIERAERLWSAPASRPTADELREARTIDGHPFVGWRSRRELRPGPGGAPAYVHGRGETGYSLANVFRALIERDPTLAPREWELSKSLIASGYPVGVGGMLVPLGGDELMRLPGHEATIERVAAECKGMFTIHADPDEVRALALRTRAMDPLNDALGGSFVPLPTQGQLIDLLRPLEIFSRAGAQQVPVPPGGLVFPRWTADATFQWLLPNQTITDSDPGTGQLTLVPKKAGGLVKIPNELLRFGTPAAETIIRSTLAARAAITADTAFLSGSGGVVQPLGLLNYPRSANNTPTPGSVTLHVAGTTGGTGDTLLPEDILKMLALVEEANDPGATAWAMRPLMFAGLANLRADGGGGAGTGPFLFPITRGALGGAVMKEMAGLPVLTSTLVPNTRQKGGVSTLTVVLCGNFTRFVIGRLGAIELAASEHAGFSADQVWIRATLRIDGAPATPESFCVSDTLVIPS